MLGCENIFIPKNVKLNQDLQEFSDFDSSTSDAKIPPCSISFDGVSYSATFPLSNTKLFHDSMHYRL